jgi:hypothetical protein
MLCVLLAPLAKTLIFQLALHKLFVFTSPIIRALTRFAPQFYKIFGKLGIWHNRRILLELDKKINWSHLADSNRGPTVYKTVALPLS